MARSPGRQESAALSDDSGVDVRTRGGGGASRCESSSSSGRRNKRKSSEPRRRKDVLLMKRFRWEDTDEEEDDVFLEGEERPSSGDSGCCRLEEEEEEDTSRPPPVQEKKKKPWRKPARTSTEPAAPRQSVICKTEPQRPGSSRGDDEEEDRGEEGRGGGRPRNYKSMSRQRRIEANARERTRVHTISAAFESLRRCVPAYAHNQKLSKLAVLRIASAYIVALACLKEEEEEEDMAGSVDRCTRTIQAEGRSRRRSKE